MSSMMSSVWRVRITWRRKTGIEKRRRLDKTRLPRAQVVWILDHVRARIV
jgi:hypothetical protein